jgi:hypothetical protein
VLSINRLNRQITEAFPIGEKSYQGARSQFILDVAFEQSHYPAAGKGGLAQLVTIGCQPRFKLDAFTHISFHNVPLVMNVALHRQ